MLTVKEAAAILNVSPQRVVQLLNAGQLIGQKRAGVWLIDEHSVRSRMTLTNKQGGRPRKQTPKLIQKYTLMNRTHEIADLEYAPELHVFSKVGSAYDSARAPLSVFDHRGHASLAAFNQWWRNRGIPNTRAHLAQLLDAAGVAVPEELLIRNLGLSLSDQYWIRPDGSELRWEDVNFFQNSFEAVSLATAHAAEGIDFFPHHTGAHPNNTSDGNLTKRWVIRRGRRVLIKEGGVLGQEPFNEVVATALHHRLLKKNEYVPYRLEASAVACSCPNFLQDSEEYIPALYVMRSSPQAAGDSDYRHYLRCCEALGVEFAEQALWHMIVCDDLIANTDRHFRNFGIVRDVDTLACRPAPIFDSGTSLWCDVSLSELKDGIPSFRSKHFEEHPGRQLLLVEDLSWVRVDKLEGFVDEAVGILAQDPMLEERLPYIRRALEHRVTRMRLICE